MHFASFFAKQHMKRSSFCPQLKFAIIKSLPRATPVSWALVCQYLALSHPSQDWDNVPINSRACWVADTVCFRPCYRIEFFTVSSPWGASCICYKNDGFRQLVMGKSLFSLSQLPCSCSLIRLLYSAAIARKLLTPVVKKRSLYAEYTGFGPWHPKSQWD